MELSEKARRIYEEFQNANGFKATIGLDKDIKRTVLFENGKQWNMDDDIADFPKITLNIIKQIGKTRKSNIMQNEYGYLVNSTNFKSIRKIQDFLKYLASTVNMKSLDLKAVNDDYVKGTAIGYFYWDADKRAFLGSSGGAMRYEIIDIRNFAVADPYIQNIQDQEWVTFVTREKIGALKAKYGAHINFISDGNLYTGSTETEPVAIDNDDELVNVYTKFYRNRDKQVHFVISTETQILKDATPLNPFYAGDDTREEPNSTSLHEVKRDTPEDDARADQIWNLYPFVRLSLNERDNCFYGVPVALEYIETQKSINNHYSVYDKALQDNVLGGFVFRKGVVDENEITTENGQMIALDSLPNEKVGDVFSRIPVANVPADSQRYSQMLIQMQREVAGTPNVQLGISDYSGQSGKQTEMLLQRAQENASDTAMIFNQFKVDQAYVMFLFAKFFYDHEDFVIIEHGNEEDSVREYTGKNKFVGTEYINDKVLIDIKVGAAPAFSEYTNIEMLGLMVQSGQAPFEAYINMLPEGYISNKDELIQISKDNSLKQINALQEQLKQQGEVMNQMTDAYKRMKKDVDNVDTLVRENEQLKSMIAELASKSLEQRKKDGEEQMSMAEEMRHAMEYIQKMNLKKE